MTEHVEEMKVEPRTGLGYEDATKTDHPYGEAKDTSPLQGGGPDTKAYSKSASKADDAAPAALSAGVPPESVKVFGGTAGDGMPPTEAKADTTQAPDATSDFVNPKKAQKEKSVNPDQVNMERQERMSFSRTMGNGTPGAGNHRNTMGSGEITPKTRGVMGNGQSMSVSAKGVMGRDIA